MMTIDDETLMAYVDGELEEHHEARVRDRLRTDPALRQRARVFEDSARALREAFRSELDRPVSKSVLELLHDPAGSTAARQGPPAAGRRSFRRGGKPAALALAASLLLAVGVTVGSLVSTMMDSGRSDTGSIAILDGAQGWNSGLDTTPSGKPFTVAGVDGGSSETIVATTTFLDQQDRYCRAYRRGITSRPDIERLRGIACRDAADGTWHTRVLVAESAPAPADTGAQGGDGGYRPAAGPAADDFERILESYMTTSPLSAADEARLIEGGWH